MSLKNLSKGTFPMDVRLAKSELYDMLMQFSIDLIDDTTNSFLSRIGYSSYRKQSNKN